MMTQKDLEKIRTDAVMDGWGKDSTFRHNWDKFMKLLNEKAVPAGNLVVEVKMEVPSSYKSILSTFGVKSYPPYVVNVLPMGHGFFLHSGGQTGKPSAQYIGPNRAITTDDRGKSWTWIFETIEAHGATAFLEFSKIKQPSGNIVSKIDIISKKKIMFIGEIKVTTIVYLGSDQVLGYNYDGLERCASSSLDLDMHHGVHVVNIRPKIAG